MSHILLPGIGGVNLLPAGLSLLLYRVFSPFFAPALVGKLVMCYIAFSSRQHMHQFVVGFCFKY